MNTDEIKKMIETASASTGEPDVNWEAAAVDRLYFFDPKNQETSGCVDVVRSAPGTPGPVRVRLELWIEPTKAAEIIGIVTGGIPSLEARVIGLVKAGRLPMMPPEPAPKPPLPPVTFGAAPAPAVPQKPTLEERDAARSIELAALIAAQAADEEEDAKVKPKKAKKAEPEDDEEPEDSDGLPPEVMADE